MRIGNHMKRLFILFSIIVALSAQAEDMHKYLNDTQDMARNGEHQEALERYVWFHDHALEHSPSMYGVRLSFALNSWKNLGEDYPPAMAELKKKRNSKTTLIEQGKGNAHLFHDVMALNRVLNEGKQTVDLFRKMDQKQENLAQQCWSMAKKPVIKAKAYDLAGKYFGTPEKEYLKVKASYDRLITMYDENDPRQSLKTFNEKNFVEEVLSVIEVTIALGDTSAARDIQKKALEVLSDHRLREAVAQEPLAVPKPAVKDIEPIPSITSGE